MLAALILVPASGSSWSASATVGPVAHRRHVQLTKNPHYCDGCTPPLIYTNGPVLDATSTHTLTVTPIYWEPAGGSEVFPPGYEDVTTGYLDNVAAASGSDRNVFSVDTEYYSLSHGLKTAIAYNFAAGTPIVDSNPYPARKCRPRPGYTQCVTDRQLRTELTRVLRANGLPSGLGAFYPVFFPPGVETVDRDGSNSADDFCGYHRSYGEGPTVIAYANVPYEESGCDAGQEPNGSYAVDAAVGTLSHELNEAVTDPTDPIAWEDSSGNEMADICTNDFGPPLGSTDPLHPGRTEYNQVINGGKYYTQTEFSNYAFSTYGTGHGCVQSEVQAHTAPPGDRGAGQVATMFADATPTKLPSFGSYKSSITIDVSDSKGYGIAGDPVHFQVYPRSGTGLCGHLNRTQTTTDATGATTVVYRATRSNVVCAVDAVEGNGGRLAESIVYQGTTRRDAPTLHAVFPHSLVAGGASVLFTITLHNPSRTPVTSARLDLAFFQGAARSPGVHGSQIHLSYSTTGPGGFFRRVVASGSTARDGEIDLTPGSEAGSTLEPHTTRTYTFRIALAADTPTDVGKAPTLAIEAYLDQIATASGSGTTLDDSYSSNLSVTG